MSEKNLKQNIVSGMFWKFAERGFGQGVSFVVSLILARLLMPDDYGIVAIVNIFITIADVFLTSGLGASLIQKKEVTQLEFSTIFYCNLILGLLLYLLLFYAAPLIAKIYKIELLTPIIRVFALRLPISAIQSIQIAHISRNMQFRRLFFSTISGTAVSAAVGIWMAYHNYGAWALVTQTLVNVFINTVVLSFTVKWRPTRQFSFATVKPLINYGWKFMTTDLIGTVFNQLSSMVIGFRYTTSDLAYFTKGRSFPQLARDNILATLVGVLFPAISSVGDEFDEVKKIARRTITTTSFLIYPMMFGMIGVSRNMVIVLITEKWLPSVPFILIFCVESMMSVIGTISHLSIKAIGRSDITLKMEFVKKPVYVLFLLIGIRFGPLAIALAILATGLFETALNGFYTHKLIDYGFWEQIRDCLKPLLASTIMYVCIMLVDNVGLPPISALVMQIVIGVAVYLGIAILTKDESFHFLCEIIRGKLLHKA